MGKGTKRYKNGQTVLIIIANGRSYMQVGNLKNQSINKAIKPNLHIVFVNTCILLIIKLSK